MYLSSLYNSPTNLLLLHLLSGFMPFHYTDYNLYYFHNYFIHSNYMMFHVHSHILPDSHLLYSLFMLYILLRLDYLHYMLVMNNRTAMLLCYLLCFHFMLRLSLYSLLYLLLLLLFHLCYSLLSTRIHFHSLS